MQCFHKRAMRYELGHQRSVTRFGLARGGFFRFANARWKAGVFVDLLAQSAFLGQHQFGHAAPGVEVVRLRAGQGFLIGARGYRRRRDGGQMGACVAQQRGEFRTESTRQQRRQSH